MRDKRHRIDTINTRGRIVEVINKHQRVNNIPVWIMKYLEEERITKTYIEQIETSELFYQCIKSK